MAPSSRLDLVLVPADPLRNESDGRWLLEDLVADGTIEPGGRAGVGAAEWLSAGFSRVSLDRPVPTPDGLAFWSNRTGGFRVACPATGRSIVPAFGAATTGWRAGGPRTVPCPACGVVHRLEDLAYAPAAAFGPWAIVTSDAGGTTLTASASARVESWIGPHAVVLRRG